MKNNMFDKSNVSKAVAKDIDALKYIWGICFEDKPQNIDIFFNDRFTFTDCYVYNENDIPVAMTYVLPTHLKLEGTLYPMGYIYACATLPKYRSGGIMSGLIKTAMQELSDKYDAFALVPAQPSLFDYYAKIGFERFFEQNVAQIEGQQEHYNCHVQLFEPSVEQFGNIMNSQLRQYNASVIWDERHIDNALKSASVYGGKAIAFDVDGKPVCALCYVNDDRVDIAELFCSCDVVDKAVAIIMSSFGANNMTVRLPYQYKSGNFSTKPVDRGMLCNVRIPKNMLLNQSGYLSLAMD